MRVDAAPLDARARTLLVAWLSVWFVAVAALLAWSVAGGGVVALGAAVLAGTLLPVVLLARLAGFPSAFEVDGGVLRVRRHLLPDRTFAIRGPVAGGAGPVPAGGAGPVPAGGGWTGRRYGCRWTAWAAGSASLASDPRERVFLAVTDATCAVRIGTAEGTVLATPADPERLAAAARAAARRAGG